MREIFEGEGPVLENERALLRPLMTEDYVHLLSFALQEPDIWFYSMINAAGEEGMRHYINSALEAKAQQKELPFIVWDKQAQAYAGCTRFYDINPAYSTLQLGYTWYGKAFQRTGLNRNCKFLLLTYAFETLGVERVEFRADAQNSRSVAAMKAIGCKVEGILRSHMPTRQGGRRDSIILSILKNEWFEDVKHLQLGLLARGATGENEI